MLAYFLYILLVSVAINLCFFIMAYKFQTDKLTDLSYTLSFVILALICFINNQPNNYFILIILFVIIFWALRLGSYLYIRITYMERDKRFDHIRSNFKSFLSFWIVQAISVSIVLIPFVLITGSSKQTNELLFFLGIGISLIGLIIEAIADFQKFKFKLKYPQKFMHTGIWSKIRHPNYTGEILFWLGITISSTSMLEQSLWLIAYISPLWISIIIILFSGIPPLEKVWNEKYKVDPDFIYYYNQSWKLIPLIY